MLDVRTVKSFVRPHILISKMSRKIAFITSENSQRFLISRKTLVISPNFLAVVRVEEEDLGMLMF